jgi:hypothetical protein
MTRILPGGRGGHKGRQALPGREAGSVAKWLYLDQVIIMTVLDFRPRGSTRFIAELKKALLREFDQEEILITEQPLRVH